MATQHGFSRRNFLALVQGLRTYDLGTASTITLIFFPVFGVMIYFLTRHMLRNEEA